MKSPIYFNSIHGNIRILLVGAGGTGSHLLHRLGAINQQLELMTNKSLLVTVCDGDTVEPHNCGRQLFDPASDIGANKAVCLVETVNRIYKTSFVAVANNFSMDLYIRCGPSLLVMAVDSVKSRMEILNSVNQNTCVIDVGNGEDFGQVLMSYNPNFIRNDSNRWFSSIADHFENLPPAPAKKEPAVSCSAVESLLRQNVLVNAVMANVTAMLIYNLLFSYNIEAYEIYVNLKTMEVLPKSLSNTKEHE